MRQKKFKYWLFDWDGCLADTLSIWLEAYTATFTEFGVEVTDHQVVQNAFGDWEGPKKLGIQDLDKFNIVLANKVEDGMKKVELHMGVVNVLSKLYEAGVKMAIVTSSLEILIQPILKKQGISGLFEGIVDMTKVTRQKPDPETVDIGLQLVGGQKQNAVVVGDSDKDIVLGKNAGITTCLFLPDINLRFYNEHVLYALNPDVVVTNFSDLEKYCY